MDPKATHGGAATEFHKAKLRAEADPSGSAFVRGFGPDGNYSLSLIKPEVTRAFHFINGRAEVKTTGRAVDDPEINALRDIALKSFTSTQFGNKAYAAIDVDLANYASAVIRKTYDVTDDDLNMLFSGTKWVEPMAVHLMGGEAARDALAKARVAESARNLLPAVTAEFDAEAALSAPDPSAGDPIPAPWDDPKWVD